MKTFKKVLTASAVAMAIATPMAANATNGILPIGNGMIAHGFGGAGIANGSEAMSGVDNPALVSRTSNQKSIGASIFSPSRSVDFGGGYVESENDYFLIPQGAYTANVDSKMDWGILVYAMGGMNTEYTDSSMPFGGGTVGVDLAGLIVAPTISYKVNNDTSVGVSLLLGYEALEFTNAGTFLPFPPSQDGSATGYGLKLGLVSEVSKGTSVGLTYQTEIEMGEIGAFCNPPFGLFAGASDCALNMPAQIGLGISHQINNEVKFVADIVDVNWSGVAVFDEVFGWEDQTIVKLGFEYQADANTAYRIGFNHGESPIPDAAMGLGWLAPAIVEDHLTLGMTNKMDKDSEISSYFAYTFENDQEAPGGFPKAKMDQFAFGVGWNWKY